MTWKKTTVSIVIRWYFSKKLKNFKLDICVYFFYMIYLVSPSDLCLWKGNIKYSTTIRTALCDSVYKQLSLWWIKLATTPKLCMLWFIYWSSSGSNQRSSSGSNQRSSSGSNQRRSSGSNQRSSSGSNQRSSSGSNQRSSSGSNQQAYRPNGLYRDLPKVVFASINKPICGHCSSSLSYTLLNATLFVCHLLIDLH